MDLSSEIEQMVIEHKLPLWNAIDAIREELEAITMKLDKVNRRVYILEEKVNHLENGQRYHNGS